MTPLETYVADKERNENVKKVRSKINELGIEYIYFQFMLSIIFKEHQISWLFQFTLYENKWHH